MTMDAIGSRLRDIHDLQHVLCGYVDACVAERRRIGNAAAWFPAVNCEQRLAEPLAQIRIVLGLQKPAVYRDALASYAGISEAA